jgi:hypothetical protein
MFSICVALLALDFKADIYGVFVQGSYRFGSFRSPSTMPVGHAGNPIAGLDAEAVEHSHERSTC